MQLATTAMLAHGLEPQVPSQSPHAPTAVWAHGQAYLGPHHLAHATTAMLARTLAAQVHHHLGHAATAVWAHGQRSQELCHLAHATTAKPARTLAAQVHHHLELAQIASRAHGLLALALQLAQLVLTVLLAHGLMRLVLVLQARVSLAVSTAPHAHLLLPAPRANLVTTVCTASSHVCSLYHPSAYVRYHFLLYFYTSARDSSVCNFIISDFAFILLLVSARYVYW